MPAFFFQVIHCVLFELKSNYQHYIFMLYSSIIFVFCLLLQPSTQQSPPLKTPFPKKLWIYWNNNPESAPIFTRLCMNNMRHYTKISGWQFTILDNDNVFRYISAENAEKLNFLKKQIATNLKLTPQALSDLHRLFVLYENGGMYIDATSFFVHDFSWVDNIHYQKTVENKVVEDPDLVMFIHDWMFAKNKTYVYDEKLKFNVKLFPSNEYYVFLAKAKTKFLADIMERMIYTFKKSSLEEYYEQNQRLGFQYLKQANPYFVYSTYQLQTQIQFKQKEIQRNPQNFDVKYAVQYYKIWNIDALQTAVFPFQLHQFKTIPIMKALFYKPISQVTQKWGKNIYFLKFIAAYSQPANDVINTSIEDICLNSIEPFPSNSIISEFLFKYSPNEQIVQRILQFQGKKERNEPIECKNMVSPIQSYIFNLAAKIYLGLLLLSLLTFKCIRKMGSKPRQPQKMKQVQKSQRQFVNNESQQLPVLSQI